MSDIDKRLEGEVISSVSDELGDSLELSNRECCSGIEINEEDCEFEFEITLEINGAIQSVCILDDMICGFKSGMEAILYFDEDYLKDLEDLMKIFENDNIDAFENEIFLNKAINILIYSDLLGKNLYLENPKLKLVFKYLLEHAKFFLHQLMRQNNFFFINKTINIFSITNLYLKFFLVNQTLGIDGRFSVDSSYLISYLNLKIHFFDLVNIVLSKFSDSNSNT